MQKVLFVTSLALANLVMGAVAALAQSPDPASIIGSAANGVKDEVFKVAVVVLPIAGLFMAITFGWRFFKKVGRPS